MPRPKPYSLCSSLTTIAQGVVIFALAPLVIPYLAITVGFTVCFWREDDLGCPIPPPFVSVPINLLFKPWN
jgi:hypothetical protein